MWHDEGTWIAVGVSALFVVVGLLMHRIFVRILKKRCHRAHTGKKP
jgi:hypothetical protein